jgi:hypothetical protein
MATLHIVPRAEAVLYGGSNSAELLTLLNDTWNWMLGQTSWSVLSETGGVITLRSNAPDVWTDITLNTGDYLYMPDCQAVPAAMFALRYHTL